MTTLPGSHIEIFPVNLGGNSFGWTSDEATSHAVLDAFVEAGGNFIDTADSYSAWVDGHEGGESEAIIGRWLQASGRREDVLIATKVAKKPGRSGLSHDNVLAALEESMQRLHVSHVDLYYGHFDDEEVAVEDQAQTFHSLVESGMIRAVGLSNYSPERLRAWCAFAQREGLTVPAALQPRYNLVSRKAYESDYAPVAADFEMAVFPYPALASGFLTGKYRTEADFEAARGGAARRYLEQGGQQVVDALLRVAEGYDVEPATVALAWVLAKGVTAPIASVSSVDQLPSLMSAPTLELSAADLADLDEASSGF